MSQAFATFQLWQAASLASPSYAQQTNNLLKFSDIDDPEIKVDYCVPSSWIKKRTDVTGVQNEQDVHPDTGPAGAFVEIQFTVDRSSNTPNILKTLIRWYGTQNTNSDFKRGFLGLTNSDNPELDLIPESLLGYKLVQFQQINPIDFKARQIYRILLQLGGKAIDLPNLS